MLRNITLTTLLTVLAVCSTSDAQEWARKMFPKTSHDFGTVANNAKAEINFKLTNKYKEDIHIAGARSTCGCTTVTVPKATLKTHETGTIHARLNTDSYQGHRSATITVTIDRPYYAEVQLTVYGHIRRDVLLTPGVVQLGSVSQGDSSPVKKIHVNYSGSSSWAITDVRSANPHLEVTMKQKARNYNGVSYELGIRLKEDAPVGYCNEPLILVTNDGQSQKIPLPVEGRVVAPVVVSPDALHFGTLVPGQKVVKQIIVRGKRPVTITRIEAVGAGGEFQYKTPAEAKLLHFVPITFIAGTTPGKTTQKIHIHTDLGGVKPAMIVTSATIKEPDYASRKP